MSPEDTLKVAEEEVKIQEKITSEELANIISAKNKAVYMTALAEKAYAEARTAELEHQNFVLSICNKYKLELVAGDAITENGMIRRANKATEQKEENNG